MTSERKTPLLEAREYLGLSRAQVVRQLDPPISEKTLERMEKGEARLKRFRVEALATIYGVDADDLMKQAA